MKYLLIPAILFIAACDNMGSNTTHITDSAASVQLIPSDSPNQQMPVQPVDTTVPAPMPTVDPDTSRVQPK